MQEHIGIIPRAALPAPEFIRLLLAIAVGAAVSAIGFIAAWPEPVTMGDCYNAIAAEQTAKAELQHALDAAYSEDKAEWTSPPSRLIVE